MSSVCTLPRRAGGVIGLCTAILLAGILLAGCGSSQPFPHQHQGMRPGVDRDVTATTALPPPVRSQPHVEALPAVDETRGPIGSIVAAKGGQKAQQEAVEQEIERRSRRERDVRQREAAGSAPSPDPEPAPADRPPPAE